MKTSIKMILALALALTMICALGTAAFADTPIIITKNPTNERHFVGESAMFIAGANNFDRIEWRFIAPNGSDCSLDAFTAQFPACSVKGQGTTTLVISNMQSGMDGWRAYCRFCLGSSHALRVAVAQCLNAHRHPSCKLQDEPQVRHPAVAQPYDFYANHLLFYNWHETLEIGYPIATQGLRHVDDALVGGTTEDEVVGMLRRYGWAVDEDIHPVQKTALGGHTQQRLVGVARVAPDGLVGALLDGRGQFGEALGLLHGIASGESDVGKGVGLYDAHDLLNAHLVASIPGPRLWVVAFCTVVCAACAIDAGAEARPVHRCVLYDV